MALVAVRKYQPVNPRCRLSSMGVSLLLCRRNELMSGTKVIETSRAANSEQLMTIGTLCRNFPVSQGNSRKGKYETMFVTVAYAIVLNSFVGPSQAATV